MGLPVATTHFGFQGGQLLSLRYVLHFPIKVLLCLPVFFHFEFTKEENLKVFFRFVFISIDPSVTLLKATLVHLTVKSCIVLICYAFLKLHFKLMLVVQLQQVRAQVNELSDQKFKLEVILITPIEKIRAIWLVKFQISLKHFCVHCVSYCGWMLWWVNSNIY